MPSFSLFRSRSEEAHPVEMGWHYSDVESEKFEKVSPRTSRRRYLRKLIKKSSLSSLTDVGVKHRKDSIYKSSLPPNSKEEKTNEITLASLYKPLPPTPFSDSTVETYVKPPTKLNRIISPLVTSDLQKLFTGAPHFLVLSHHDKYRAGPPKPIVTFPWDSCQNTRNLRDHINIEDSLWACITTSKETYGSEALRGFGLKESKKQNKVDVTSSCRELPNMLSMQGIEKGTMGYQAALEMTVSDRLVMPDFTPWEVLYSYRASFLQRKDKLRSVTDSFLVNRLTVIGDIYQAEFLQFYKPAFQLYTELFTKILFPSSQILDIDDPYSLQVQIYHLIEILKAPKIWVDFSQMKWRIKLGQILWGTEGNQDSRPPTILDKPFGLRNFHSQKYWLLLQILIGCEIVLRLDILSNKSRYDGCKPYDKMNFFGQKPTESVNWTLLLARTWLENIRLEVPDSDDDVGSCWMFGGDADVGSKNILGKLKFHGRHQARQISGLLHFAQVLNWPNIETLKVNMTNISRSSSEQSLITRSRQKILRTSSFREARNSKLPDRKYDTNEVPANNWLSDTYMSGLILPGESSSHLLMSTLLKNDIHTLPKLGQRINPDGAFIYSGRSFWSTANVVGKVLAARKSSTECLGWVSSDVHPRGVKEGWVDIEAQSRIESYQDKKTKKARIWHKKTVERHGSVIAGADASSILRGDFVLPSERPICPSLSVKFLSLDMFALDDRANDDYGDEYFPDLVQSENEKDIFPLFSATMRFFVESALDNKTEVSIDLAHDIFFITAHPCNPPNNKEILHMSTDSSIGSLNSQSQNVNKRLGHPLHKAFTYTKLSLSHVLSTPVTINFSTLLTPPASPDPTQSSLHTTSSNIPKILVLDCTEDDSQFEVDFMRDESSYDKEMLARAVCAERGWNALISRKDRCCLACSIREASALGHRVIIRL